MNTTRPTDEQRAILDRIAGHVAAARKALEAADSEAVNLILLGDEDSLTALESMNGPMERARMAVSSIPKVYRVDWAGADYWNVSWDLHEIARGRRG